MKLSDYNVSELSNKEMKEINGGLPWLLFAVVALAIVGYYAIVGSPYSEAERNEM
jgi:lactobin A/cerein 7B family class IIb bacteriocin